MRHMNSKHHSRIVDNVAFEPYRQHGNEPKPPIYFDINSKQRPFLANKSKATQSQLKARSKDGQTTGMSNMGTKSPKKLAKPIARRTTTTVNTEYLRT
jgi:hypothetical protein